MHVLQGPQWINFGPAGHPGVDVLFAPCSPAARRKASQASTRVLLDAGVEVVAGEKLPDDVNRDVLDASLEAYARVLIRAGIQGWKGLGQGEDETSAAPLEYSPEAVEAFLADPEMFEAANLLYVGPIMERLAEKNASSGSPDGTSAGRTRAKGSAATARRPARSAPTKSTSPKPRKAKASGK